MLTVTAADAPRAVDLWTASSTDRDFRDDRWTSTPLSPQPGAAPGTWVARVKVPDLGFAALYASLTYRSTLGHDYTLSTNVEVIGRRP